MRFSAPAFHAPSFAFCRARGVITVKGQMMRGWALPHSRPLSLLPPPSSTTARTCVSSVSHLERHAPHLVLRVRVYPATNERREATVPRLLSAPPYSTFSGDMTEQTYRPPPICIASFFLSCSPSSASPKAQSYQRGSANTPPRGEGTAPTLIRSAVVEAVRFGVLARRRWRVRRCAVRDILLPTAVLLVLAPRLLLLVLRLLVPAILGRRTTVLVRGPRGAV